MRKLLTRALSALALLCALSSSALAIDVTIAGASFPAYNYAGATAKLRIYPSQTFTASDSTTVPGGTVPGSKTGFFYTVNCTVASNTLTCPSVTLKSTTDALDNRDTTYSVKLFDAGDTPRDFFPLSDFALPHTLGASTTWAAVRDYNSTHPRAPAPGYYDADQTNAAINSALATGNPMTTTTLGRAKASATPTDPAAPVVITQEDTRLPTQAENDALAGTAGSPSASNKFVTDQDSRLASVLPLKFLFASKLAGVTLDCNTTTYAGTDNTAALQAAINTVSTYGTLLLFIDGKSVTTGLNLPSNVTLAGLNPGDGLCLKSGSNRAVIRNANQTEGSLSLIANENITLKNLTIYGNRDGQVKCNGSCVTGGEYNVGLQFFGVRNLHLENVRIYNSKNFNFHAANFDGVYLDDSTAEQSDYTVDNHDGWHFNGPGRNVRARVKCIKTTDDCFAVNAFDPVNIHVGVTNGPITDVDADVTWENVFYGFRVTASGSSYADRLTFKGRGVIQEYGLRLDNGGEYGGTAGAIKGVTADLEPEGFYSGSSPAVRPAVFIHGYVEQAKLRIRQNGSWYSDYRAAVATAGSESVTNSWCSPCTWQAANVLSMDLDLDVVDPAGVNPAAAGSGYRVEVPGGTLGFLSYKYHHSRDASVSQSNGALWVKGGSVGEVILEGGANRQNNLVAITSGSLSFVRFAPFTNLADAGSAIKAEVSGGSISTYPSVSGDLFNGGGSVFGGADSANVTAVQLSVDGRRYDLVGSALTISSNTIAPTASAHHVGAGLIKTITVPSGFRGGCVELIPDAAFTTDATGNVSKASTAVVGQAMRVCYDAGAGKWYPSY